MFKSVSIIDYYLESIVLSTSPYNRLTLSIDCMFDFAIWQFQFMQMPLVAILTLRQFIYMSACSGFPSWTPDTQFVSPLAEWERERESYSREREYKSLIPFAFLTITQTHTAIHTLGRPEEEDKKIQKLISSEEGKEGLKTPLKLKLGTFKTHFVSLTLWVLLLTLLP